MNTKTNILKKILEVEKDKTKKIAFLVDAVYTVDELIKSKQNEEEKGMCYTIKASYEADLAESALEESLKSPIFEQIIGKISHESDGFIEELKQNSNLRKYFLRMAVFDNLTGAELIRRYDVDSKFEQHYYITKFNAAMCAFDLFMLAHDQKDVDIALEAYKEYTSYFIKDPEFLRCINLHIPHPQIGPYSLSLRNIRILRQYQESTAEDVIEVERELKKRKMADRRKKKKYKQHRREK